MAQGIINKIFCITCAKKLDSDDEAKHRGRWKDDPYFYSRHYYDGYYWGSDDFNDGDEAILEDQRDPDDLKGFENDMGGS